MKLAHVNHHILALYTSCETSVFVLFLFFYKTRQNIMGFNLLWKMWFVVKFHHDSSDGWKFGAQSLTHWGWDKMYAIFQSTYSNAFSWIKLYEFHWSFHWHLFLRFKLTKIQHWCRKWLGADQATSCYLGQWWLVYWHIHVSLGLNELSEVTASNSLESFKFINWFLTILPQ